MNEPKTKIFPPQGTGAKRVSVAGSGLAIMISGGTFPNPTLNTPILAYASTDSFSPALNTPSLVWS